MSDKKKNKSEKVSYILTKETIGMTLMLFGVIVFVMLLSYDKIFAGFGWAICTFMYGVFGYGSLLVVMLLAYLGEWLVFGKSRRQKDAYNLFDGGNAVFPFSRSNHT